MKCPKCGAVIPDGSRFCNFCGEKVNIKKPEHRVHTEAIRPRDEDFDIAPTVRKKPERMEPEDHNQKDWVILLILLAALLLAALGVLIFESVKKNQKTVINVVTPTEEETTAPTKETLPEKTTSKTTASETESEGETTEETEGSSEETSEAPASEIPAESSEETTASQTPAPEDPGEDLEYGGVVYHIANGQATLLRCYSADNVMEMPATVYGVPCVAIAPEAFKDCEHLTHIDLPEGYLAIGDRAFYNCKNLKEIVMPDTLGEVGAGAFDYCGAFTIISHKDTFAYALATNNNIPWLEGAVLTIISQ